MRGVGLTAAGKLDQEWHKGVPAKAAGCRQSQIPPSRRDAGRDVLTRNDAGICGDDNGNIFVAVAVEGHSGCQITTLDGSGRKTWTRDYGAKGEADAITLKLDGGGNLYLLGRYRFVDEGGRGQRIYQLMRIDSQGNVVGNSYLLLATLKRVRAESKP